MNLIRANKREPLFQKISLVAIASLFFFCGCMPSTGIAPKPEPVAQPTLSSEEYDKALKSAGGFNPNACNPEESYKRGMNDAKAGKNPELAFLGLCNYDLKISNEAAYRKGYSEAK